VEAQLADEFGTQNRAFRELEINVMALKVGGALCQRHATHAAILVGVRVVADGEIERVVLGEKQLPGKVRVLIDCRAENAFMNGTRGRHRNDRSTLKVLMKVA